jgi:hypothetical protein
MIKKASLLIIAMSVLLVSFVSAQPDKTNAFVCPVFDEKVGNHNPNAFAIGEGHYSLIPSGNPHIISVPEHATNGDGSGTPPGPHSEPGDTDYTAIWKA